MKDGAAPYLKNKISQRFKCGPEHPCDIPDLFFVLLAIYKNSNGIILNALNKKRQ